MESLIKIILIVSSLSLSVQAKEKSLGRLYFQDFMGHLHKEPSDASASLTALQCAHAVNIIEQENIAVPTGWMLARVGEDLGFIRSKFLASNRPECFQEKYPKFYSNLNIDLTDLYYWGRLSDHFIEGESQAR